MNQPTSTLFLETSCLSVNERIQMYEERYIACMESTSRLSIWIQSIKEKGPPSPLSEGYSPPVIKSRLSDYFKFSSSPRRRKSLIPADITPSLSTLFKKASDSITTTYKQSRKPDLTIHTSLHTNQRFPFNRFATSKSSEGKHRKRFSISEKRKSISPPSPTPIIECCAVKELTPPSSPSSIDKKKRTSLLITPSLSTIRLTPNFLRRQSIHV